MEPSEYGKVMQIRERVGLRPGSIGMESRRRGAKEGKRVLGGALNQTIDSDRGLIVDILTDERDELIDDLYLEPTAAGITAKYLIERAGNVAYTVALQDLDNNDVPNFTLYYDLGYGLITIGAKIALADKVRALGRDQMINKAGSNQFLRYALGEDTTFLKGLLDQDDGKGLVLVDTCVDVLRGKVPAHVTAMGPSHIPEFVVAGAELGAEVFRKLHPLASQLVK
jgi:hypothetical protein